MREMWKKTLFFPMFTEFVWKWISNSLNKNPTLVKFYFVHFIFFTKSGEFQIFESELWKRKTNWTEKPGKNLIFVQAINGFFKLFYWLNSNATWHDLDLKLANRHYFVNMFVLLDIVQKLHTQFLKKMNMTTRNFTILKSLVKKLND
jgi:hypothetical protein